MAKNEEQYDKIQRYLDNDMSKQELSDFEQEIGADQSLADEVSLHQDMQEFLSDTQENKLRKQLEQLSSDYDDTSETQKFTAKQLLWLLPIFLLVGVFWVINPTPEKTSTSSPNSNSAVSQPEIKETQNTETSTQEDRTIKQEESNKEEQTPSIETPKKEKTNPDSEEVQQKTKPTDFIKKDLPQAEKKTNQVIAANFDPNPSLDFLIENNTRSNETSLSIEQKQANQKFIGQNKAVPFQVKGTFSSTENLLDKEIKLHLFSNDLEAFDNFEPLFSKDILLTSNEENTYLFDFKDQFKLEQGLYYYIIEDVQEEKIYFVEKFELRK